MMTAKVGDESCNDDYSVNELLEIVNSLLKKEASIFLPTTTMANLIAVMVHCNPGEMIFLDETTHSYLLEAGGISGIAGVMPYPLSGKNGIFTTEQIEELFFSIHSGCKVPKPRMIQVEQTTNIGGGAIWSVDEIKCLFEYSNNHEMSLHIDGARIFNAAIGSGIEVHKFSELSHSICIDFTKGLGAPFGSVLAGDSKFINECSKIKTRLGGSMHQVGFMAKACLYSLNNNIDQLSQDHKNAKLFAEHLSKYPSIHVCNVQTNIVRFLINIENLDAFMLTKLLKENGVHVLPLNYSTIRAVTSMNVNKRDIQNACSILDAILLDFV